MSVCACMCVETHVCMDVCGGSCVCACMCVEALVCMHVCGGSLSENVCLLVYGGPRLRVGISFDLACILFFVVGPLA